MDKVLTIITKIAGVLAAIQKFNPQIESVGDGKYKVSITASIDDIEGLFKGTIK